MDHFVYTLIRPGQYDCAECKRPIHSRSCILQMDDLNASCYPLHLSCGLRTRNRIADVTGRTPLYYGLDGQTH